MSVPPKRIPTARLRVRLRPQTVEAAKRAHAAYMALHPKRRLDSLYRALLTKLARDLEAQCRKQGIDPDKLVSKGSKPSSSPPDHIRKKKSPTYDEL